MRTEESVPAPNGAAADAAGQRAVPAYLEQAYWWAYVHPRAVRLFERDWLVNLILFGNYGRLRDAALAGMQTPLATAQTDTNSLSGNILQVACAYGDITPTLLRRLDAQSHLDVVDVLPIQLNNLQRKLPADARVGLIRADASALPFDDGSYDQVLLFFLLHEMPEPVRRATLAEALRVLRPGGRLVIIDYHAPRRWHPLRWLMRGVFRQLEPFAMDLWRHPVEHFMPNDLAWTARSHHTYFGGLYQRLIVTR